MQFKVPQFLDIEDKIFGPFTFRQFIYLVGGGGICFVIYKLIGLLFGLIPILAIAAFSLALAFYKPNNKPFVAMVESVFKYVFQNKLYIWKNPKNKTERDAQGKDGKPVMMMENEASYAGAKLSGSKLRDLAWSLDILDLRKEDLKKEK